jgi:lysophospholipase L1-like esterase
MHRTELTDDLFQRHIEIQHGDGWVKPWRLPYTQRALFPSPDDGLLGRAENTSGVRLRLATASQTIRLGFEPLPASVPAAGRPGFCFDLTIDGELIASASVLPEGTVAEFSDLPAQDKIVEIWLSQEIPVAISSLESDEPCHPATDDRRRWVTYGSSLTHCVRAHSPARTWPAIVARRHGLHLTSLGFGGQCHLDAMVGRVISQLPADLITLKLGINTISGTLSARTYPAAIVGLVQIIRDHHPDTPMALVSPIGFPPNETEPNRVDYTIGAMRDDMKDIHRHLVDLGDTNLIYVNGLEVFDLELIARHAEDQCHPDGDGIEIQADNFDRAVMAKLLGQ